MAAKRTKTSLQNALKDRKTHKGHAELRSDIEKLLDTADEFERVDAVIKRVQRYAVEAMGESVGSDFSYMYGEFADKIKTIIREELVLYVSDFISDTHRKFVVRCHARGMSTSQAAWELLKGDATMNRLVQKDALGRESLQAILVHRLSYLKPGSARWPEAKYGAVWREAREKFRQQMSDIPYTSQVEQIALLAKNAERINSALDNERNTVKDYQLLTNSLTKTLESLRKLSAVEEPMPAKLTEPQLVGVLERLTLALKAPDQIGLGGEAKELVGVLERLTLALKSPQGEGTGNGAKALPREAGVVQDKTG